MRMVWMFGLLALLAGCVQVPLAPEKQFESFRADLKARCERGEISRVEEQERLRDRFWQVFGRDPESVGHFAYSISLMRSAEAGAIPLEEAQALVGAREAAIMAMKMESRRVPSSYEYPAN